MDYQCEYRMKDLGRCTNTKKYVKGNNYYHRYCSAHVERLRKGADMDAPIYKKGKHIGCKFIVVGGEECGEHGDWFARGYCKKHYTYVMGTSSPRRITPIGTLRYDKSGYVEIKVSAEDLEKYGESKRNFRGGWLREHRLVMAKSLGRKLLAEENVHHIDGDRSNNNIENLELWSRSQPSGQRISDKVKWAREIIELYGEYYE